MVASPVPLADQPLSGPATAIYAVIQEAGEPLGKGRLLELSGVGDEDWWPAIKDLGNRGLITAVGKGKGTAIGGRRSEMSVVAGDTGVLEKWVPMPVATVVQGNMG